MAKKIRITPWGHTVKGALATCIAPRLATDSAVKPGELNALMRGLPAKKTFTDSIPDILSAVDKTFKSRLAKDADLEDLPEILEALKSAAEEEENEEGEDKFKAGDEEGEELPEGSMDDDNDDDDEKEGHPGVKLMKMLSGYDIPTEDLEQMNGLITALSKGKEGDKMKDEFPPKKDAEKRGGKREETPGAVTKEAMDAAFKTHEKQTREKFAALFAAADRVAPILGKVDTLAFDSADGILKLALDRLEVDTKGVHPSAYGRLLDMAQTSTRQPVRPSMAVDAKDLTDFNTMYPNQPIMA